MGSRRYLQPEPLLQDPDYIKDMATAGHAVPTYAYALNNPIRYTDPSGLYAWIEECSGGGISVETASFEGGDDRRGRYPGYGFNFWDTSGTVQFNTGGRDACKDLDMAYEASRVIRKRGDGRLLLCWKKLIKQLVQACPDGIQRPKKEPELKPPEGYCQQR